MIVSVHQPQYIPWLGYFDKIDKSDCFVFLDTVQYKKREYQNRNKVKTRQGSLWLTVPVKTKGHNLQPIFEVQVDNGTDWAEDHIKSLQMCYGNSPFFKQYYPFLRQVYSKKWDRLIDLNICIIEFVLKELGINTKLILESELGTTMTSTDRIIEICTKLEADIYLSGTGGKAYLDEDRFTESGIGLEYQDFVHPEYSQMFVDGSHPFIGFLSILDLMFNEGPRSLEIIRGGKTNF